MARMGITDFRRLAALSPPAWITPGSKQRAARSTADIDSNMIDRIAVDGSQDRFAGGAGRGSVIGEAIALAIRKAQQLWFVCGGEAAT